MNTIKVPRQKLLDLDVIDEAIEDKIIDHSRWSVRSRIVFKMDEKHWIAYYSVGATEQQDESPWEYEEEVELTEAILQEVTIRKWVPME